MSGLDDAIQGLKAALDDDSGLRLAVARVLVVLESKAAEGFTPRSEVTEVAKVGFDEVCCNGYPDVKCGLCGCRRGRFARIFCDAHKGRV